MPEQKNEKTYSTQRLKDTMKGLMAEKQEERKDEIKEGTESSLRHTVQEGKQFKRATGQRVKNHLNSVKWLQGVKFQSGTKPKGQQECSKQPRDWGYRIRWLGIEQINSQKTKWPSSMS